ncbi:MAG: hypothetical protein IPJ18_22240 [Betaproteobacteria bacterium]|nr:hypothetical protein [Betaproteobacteria bacterium]
MSHELRTPLNAILGFGQLLELEHQSDQDRLVWGREVVKGGRHLLELINEVLDLAQSRIRQDGGAAAAFDARGPCWMTA